MRKETTESIVEQVRLDTPEGIRGVLQTIINDVSARDADKIKACTDLSKLMGFDKGQFSDIQRMSNEDLAQSLKDLSPLVYAYLKCEVEFRQARGGSPTLAKLRKDKRDLEVRIECLELAEEERLEELRIAKEAEKENEVLAEEVTEDAT